MDMLNHVESSFVGYSEIIEAFGRDKIEERYNSLLEEAIDFIEKMDYSQSIIVDKLSLVYVVLDYFSDILRLKRFHEIDLVAEEKIVAYEVSWLLRRMPFQKIKSNDEAVFVNERFAVSLILQYMAHSVCDGKISTIPFSNIKFFTETLFYFLKYRPVDARSLELVLLSFQAGLLCGKESVTGNDH